MRSALLLVVLLTLFISNASEVNQDMDITEIAKYLEGANLFILEG